MFPYLPPLLFLDIRYFNFFCILYVLQVNILVPKSLTIPLITFEYISGTWVPQFFPSSPGYSFILVKNGKNALKENSFILML